MQTFQISETEWNQHKIICTVNKRYLGKDCLLFLYTITHKKTGCVYSGSKVAYSLNTANTYTGSSRGRRGDICTKNKILELGSEEYLFEVVEYCSSYKDLVYLENQLNLLNYKLNKNKCMNSNINGNLKSAAGISTPHSEKTKQKIREAHNKPEVKAKKSKKLKGKKTKPLSIETKDKIRKKLFGKERNNTDKEKIKQSSMIKYYCPYDKNILRTTNHMSKYIRIFYPNEKQCMQYNENERKNYMINS